MIRLFDPTVIEDRPAVERATPQSHNPGCRGCAAWEGSSVVCMRAESAAGTGPTLLVVSMSPEQSDLDLGRHLAGKRGRWLRDQIAARWQGRVVFDYAVRCHVGKAAPNKTWYDACRSYLARTVEKCKPDRVLCIGSTSAVGLLGRPVDAYSARCAWAYLPATKSTVYVIGAFHEWWGNKILTTQVEKSLDWALLQQPPKPPPLDAVALRWTPEDDPAFREWLAAGTEVTYDVETYGRQSDDDFRLLACSMAREDSSEVWVWAEEDLIPGTEGAEAVADALTSGVPMPAHNRRYDDRSVRRHLSVPYPPGACTLLDWKILHGDAFVGLETVQDAVGMGGSKDEVQPYIEAECARLRKEAKELSEHAKDPEAALKRSHKYNEPKAYAYAAIPRDMLLKYCAKDTLSTAHIRRLSRTKLAQHEVLERTMGELIIPLTGALNRMETHGVKVVREHARDLQTYFGKRIYELKHELSKYARSLTGADINFKSTKQLQEFLYDPAPDGLGLTAPWTTKTGAPSTEKAALEKLAGDAPIIRKLLAFRGVDKLSSTYAWGLERYICDDGRIHTSYKIHGAETGRLSCVAEWTPIDTLRGVVPISDVRVGDYVWTHLGRWRRVTRVFTKGPGDMVDVLFSNGKVLTCTTDHRILGANGQWRRVGEVVDEHLEKLGRGRVEPGERLAALPRVGAPDDGADRRGAGYDLPQRLARPPALHAGGGAEDAREGALLGVEDRVEERDVRQDPGAASQLERPGHGCERLRDDPRGGPPGAPTPAHHGGGPGAGEAPRQVRRSPHRQRSGEQRAGQPGDDNEARAPQDSFYAGEGVEPATVEAIHYRGRLEVHDLTVDEDASYLACGVYSHNSSNPNLQNIPSGESDDPERAADGKRIKALFLPTDDDWQFVAADYSQLEVRVAAMLSGDEVMIATLATGVDFHLATARLIAAFFNEDPAKVDKKHWLRRAAKIINFALIYGKGDQGISEELGVSVAVAGKVRAAILGRFKRLGKWIKEREEEARLTGAVWIPRFGDVLSRRRPLPHIASPNPSEQGNARRAACNTPIQGCGSEYMLASVVGIDMVLHNIKLNEWQRSSGAWDHVDVARRRYHKALKGRAKQVLTVHDSGMGDVRREVRLEYAAMMRDVMEGWPSLGVALPIDLSEGPSWGELGDVPEFKRHEDSQGHV